MPEGHPPLDGGSQPVPTRAGRRYLPRPLPRPHGGVQARSQQRRVAHPDLSSTQEGTIPTPSLASGVVVALVLATGSAPPRCSGARRSSVVPSERDRLGPELRRDRRVAKDERSPPPGTRKGRATRPVVRHLGARGSFDAVVVASHCPCQDADARRLARASPLATWLPTSATEPSPGPSRGASHPHSLVLPVSCPRAPGQDNRDANTSSVERSHHRADDFDDAHCSRFGHSGRRDVPRDVHDGRPGRSRSRSTGSRRRPRPGLGVTQRYTFSW